MLKLHLENITGADLPPISSDLISSKEQKNNRSPFADAILLLFIIETMDNALFS